MTAADLVMVYHFIAALLFASAGACAVAAVRPDPDCGDELVALVWIFLFFAVLLVQVQSPPRFCLPSYC